MKPYYTSSDNSWDFPKWNDDYRSIYPKPDKQPCLHDSCSSCGGTGVRKDSGLFCIHALSCPCPKCSPTC